MAAVDYLFTNARLPDGRVVSLAVNGGRFSGLVEAGGELPGALHKTDLGADWSFQALSKAISTWTPAFTATPGAPTSPAAVNSTFASVRLFRPRTWPSLPP